jgi:regulatory protein
MTRNGRASGSGEAAASEAAARDVQDPEARARQICLRLLTAAPRTRAQLAQAMRRGGIPAEAADAILVRFTDAGLIDDAAFARAWVESRHHSRGLSKRSLSAELRHQGIQAEEIREAIDALDPEQEVATARHLVERKMASTRGRPPETRARQAAGMLARKGYPPGLAFRLIREAMQQEGAGLGELDELDADAYLDPDTEGAGAGSDAEDASAAQNAEDASAAQNAGDASASQGAGGASAG